MREIRSKAGALFIVLPEDMSLPSADVQQVKLFVKLKISTYLFVYTQ